MTARRFALVQARARVYAMVDGSWVLGSESIALPEGYYLVSPRFVEP